LLHYVISQHSISEITRRAAAQESLLDIAVFSGEWPASKPRILEVLQSIEGGTLPLATYFVEANSHETEEPLTVEQARQRLQFFREIRLQQDVQAQLRDGHISSPEQYTPLPENEA
jgi:hypothetical protein